MSSIDESYLTTGETVLKKESIAFKQIILTNLRMIILNNPGTHFTDIKYGHIVSVDWSFSYNLKLLYVALLSSIAFLFIIFTPLIDTMGEFSIILLLVAVIFYIFYGASKSSELTIITTNGKHSFSLSGNGAKDTISQLCLDIREAESNIIC